MGDLGGGSLERVELNGGKLGRATTLALAPLRLMESCGDDRQKARRMIDKTLEAVDWLGEGRGRAFYPVGGTWRNLARLHIQQHRYPLHAIHGHTIPYANARGLTRLITRLGDRKSAGEGTRVSVRVALGVRRITKKTNT